MKKDGRQNGQHKQHAVRHVTGRGALSVLLCAAMFFTSTAFAIPSTAPGDERAQDGAVGGSPTQISRPGGDTSDGSPEQGAGATGNTAAVASASAEESGAAALPGRKAAPQPVGEGETGAADAVLYTDRSGNVGVSTEGYTDAAANLEIHADSTLRPNLGENTTNEQERTGGTLFLELERYPLTSAAFKYYCNEQAWDGKAPFRVTGEGHNIVVEAVVNDFMLENNDTYGGVTKVPPAFSFKMDHLTYQSRLPSMNFWARGNKLVIGSGVTTNAHGIIGQDTVFKIYGGAEHQTVFTQEPKVLYPTNVVVESANWDEVFGGGKANTAYGTNVTVRGTANIAYLAGGGEDECQIAVYDQADGQGDESLKGVGANVYVEGGTVGTLFGGSRVTANALLQLLDQKALNVYTPVNITVSGGSVTKLYAMNDFTGFTGTSADDTEYIRGSSVHADETVNISGEGAAQYVVGDLYRNLPVNAENQRHVLGTTRVNITASNTFQRLNYFDVVHISGTDVVVSANEVIGGSMTDSAVTAYGPDFDGYVGQIAVTNGATLLLNNRAVINNYYNNVALGDAHYQESDREIKANSYDDSYYLSHSWVGEYSEERRALSTVEINGQSVGITAASGTRFDEANDVCGLLIHGTVQGQLGSDSGYGKVPGYSTLKAAGTPIYSTANDYYYYIVADSSENGGKAFREPEGADYIVCYRYLEDGKIGWYLRQKPTFTLTNKLLRAGDDTDSAMSFHVEMNSFGYEWNSDAAENRVDFQITGTTGTDGAQLVTSTESLTLAVMAAIGSNPTGRFDNVLFETVNGVTRLRSFDYLLDDSVPVDPTLYTVETDYHVVRDSGSYEDIHPARAADAARCVYDFAGNDSLHDKEGYDDSVMDTLPYSTSPAGEDTALLRVYLPYGVTGALHVAENDGSFRFTGDTSIDAQLVTSGSVTASYLSANASYANSRFAVTIGSGELSAGVDQALTSAVSSYPCTVYSHKNLSISDISQLSSDGLQLRLTLSGLMKSGAAVGSNNPFADNNGELQIRTVGGYKITFRYTTRTQGERDYVVKGSLTDAQLDTVGRLTDAFIMSVAPFESNYGETLSWTDSVITHSMEEGAVTATVVAAQAVRQVSVTYRTTQGGMYNEPFMVDVGANRLNDSKIAAISVPAESGGMQFNYWEIRKSPAGAVIAKCYDADFTFCIMDNYWISPVFSASPASPAGEKSVTLTFLDYNRNRWTDSEGVFTPNGRSDYLYADFEIAYTDGGNDIFGSGTGYRTGVVFELCDTLTGETFDPSSCSYASDEANLKQAILEGRSSYSTGGGTRRIQCSNIATDKLTNKNRIEFGKSYYHTDTNARAIMKATAYLIDGQNEVTLSNSVYICLYDISLRDLAFAG